MASDLSKGSVSLPGTSDSAHRAAGNDSQRLQTLLNWGITHSDPSAPPPDQNTSKEHVKLLNEIMANNVSDADRMKAAVIVINDSDSSTLEERCQAWDELELLVESLDNANDLKPLQLWPHIVKHLSSSEPEVVTHALWVCGTAVQNNPASQVEFLATGSLPTVVELVSNPSATAEVRSKAIYCLSSAIKHNADAYQQFEDHLGWTHLDAALKDPSIKCRRKAAFLVDSIFNNTPNPAQVLATARKANVIATLIQSLSSNVTPFGNDGDQTSDVDLAEKAAGALHRALQRAGSNALTGPEKAEVSEALQQSEHALGLGDSEKAELVALLQS